MKQIKRTFLLIIAMLTLLGVFGCIKEPEQERIVVEDTVPIVTVTATPVPEPTRESDATPETVTAVPSDPTPDSVMTVAPTGSGEDIVGPVTTETPRVLPTQPPPTPTPEPTPTPAPTEIPFSYYAPTVNMSFEELVGSLDDFDESNPRSNDSFLMPKGYPAPDTYRIIVDLYWQVVLVYTKDENGEYTVPVRYMLCSSGDPRKYSETQTGTFKMKETRVRFGNFKTGETAQYWSLIRSRTYFHSTLYSKYRDLSSVDKASYEALAAGKKASHACIRLTVPDARWIFYNICYGTECEIRKGSKDDAETGAIRAQLHLTGWVDDADLSTANTPYTDNWRIEEVATDMPYIHATQPPVPKS